MSKKMSKKQVTAHKILAVAGDLFLRRGFTETSVEDIASAAGISRASLFNHYRGKPAIVAALAADMEPRLLQLLRHYLDKPLSTAQRLQQLFEYAARILAQTAPLTRILFVHGSNGAGFPALETEFGNLISAGVQQGDVRTDLPTRALAEMVYLAFVASLLAWCQDPAVEPEQAQAERARGLVLLLQPDSVP
jgi:AcrR family transcriptional regulator